jgi:hypothetical protein
MNKFTVRVYVATAWSFLTQADHYEEYDIESSDSLETFSKKLAREGFLLGYKVIMPGAILSVEQTQ